MDAFYASVEERDKPKLVGESLVLGGSPEKRDVASSANYSACRYGGHCAIPTNGYTTGQTINVNYDWYII